MRKWSSGLTMIVLAAGAVSESSLAVDKTSKIEQTIQRYSVALGATRVIYDPTSSGAVVSVSNPNDYPMLVQSKVFDETKQSVAPFVVTPPLFRLEGQQQSRIRMVRTGGEVAPDRETLQWLCVTGIPPEIDDTWAEGNSGEAKKPEPAASLEVTIKFTRCIKLIVRPSALKGSPTDTASSLTWQQQGKQLKVSNPTPFYMTLQSVTVGGKKVNSLDYIPPLGDRSFTLPEGTSGTVQWSIITDQGGESRLYEAALIKVPASR